MCLSVSRLFCVSSLDYPNLLGTKGYVVVVAAAASDCSPGLDTQKSTVQKLS
jgi:hypothetical protein